MTKIALTGSIASGKTTASRFISNNRGPLFSADEIVKKLYKKKDFRIKIAKEFKINLNSQFKGKLKKSIIYQNRNLKKLEKIIHPIVRKKMFIFLRKNKSKKYLFCEIPLLIESKLTKYFDVVIFIKSKKKLRLKRYKLRGGNNKLFNLLNSFQLKDSKKIRFCDHIVVNNKSLSFLKKNLLNIIKIYE